MKQGTPAGATAPLVQLRVASRKLREVLGAVVALPEEAQDNVAAAIQDMVNRLRCVVTTPMTAAHIPLSHSPATPTHILYS
jgi:hypothetical protein